MKTELSNIILSCFKLLYAEIVMLYMICLYGCDIMYQLRNDTSDDLE
jgi:hypothetical protein